jgi:hypothetical protein
VQEQDYQRPYQFFRSLKSLVRQAVDQHPKPKDEVQNSQYREYEKQAEQTELG